MLLELVFIFIHTILLPVVYLNKIQFQFKIINESIHYQVFGKLICVTKKLQYLLCQK